MYESHGAILLFDVLLFHLVFFSPLSVKVAIVKIAPPNPTQSYMEREADIIEFGVSER